MIIALNEVQRVLGADYADTLAVRLPLMQFWEHAREADVVSCASTSLSSIAPMSKVLSRRLASTLGLPTASSFLLMGADVDHDLMELDVAHADAESHSIMRRLDHVLALLEDLEGCVADF